MNQALKNKGFIAYLLVVFANIFVDFGHKVILQNTIFKSVSGSEQVLLTVLVNGLMLLPFALVLMPAGFACDRYPKRRIMRISALAALIVTLLVTYSYYTGHFYLALGLTVLLSVQSAFYSPAKYGYIREWFGNENLGVGNGWVLAVSMLALLMGSAVCSWLFAGLLPISPVQSSGWVLEHVASIGWLLVMVALFECYYTLRLPKESSNVVSTPALTWAGHADEQGFVLQIVRIIRHKTLWQSVLGISSVLFLTTVLISVFPIYAKTQLTSIHNATIQGILAMFAVGVSLGGIFAARHSIRHINLSLIPSGAILVCISMATLTHVTMAVLLAVLFVVIGFGCAMMVVPLHARLQFQAKRKELGRVLASQNMLQALVISAALALTYGFVTVGLHSTYLVWGALVLSLIMALTAVICLPQALVRGVLTRLIGHKYRLKVLGFEHFPQSEQGVLLLGNHISWLDWALIHMASPHHVHFVMAQDLYERWYFKWICQRFGVIPISAGHSQTALQRVTELLNAGKTVCLFPEGRISHLGQLGEFKQGFELACEGANGVIIPFYLRGMWGSAFSRSTKKLDKVRHKGIKRDITVAFGEPMDIHSSASEVKQKVFEMSVASWENYADTLETLSHTWIATAKSRPSKWAIVDSTGKPMSHMRCLIGSLLMKQHIASLPGQALGLMVPTSSAGLLANLATLMAGKTVVNINYTASIDAIVSAKQRAELSSVVTSRKFIEKLQQKGIDCETILDGCTVVYLEDIMGNMSQLRQWLTTLAVYGLPASWLTALYCQKRALTDTAAILFSSGSEGEPKGVMLSHRNIMANLRQVADVLNVREDDRIMATLPLFHAFGLTVTGMLPLMEGIPVICHPDPTDGANIAKAVAKHQATLMCATSTFLRMYQRNRRIKPMMFKSLRAVVSGAEKLDPDVKSAFQETFMVPVLEGYGTTETTPVASVNLPGHLIREQAYIQEAAREGTVGLALPGTTFRIVDPVSYESLSVGEDGMIMIGGAQIMQGYLKDSEKTAEVIVELDGKRWYKTGDKGHLDEDGYLTIVDRYSRFAKLAGEMVSLSAVEHAIKSMLNDSDLNLVAVNLPDEKKGEQIIVLTESTMPESEMKQTLSQQGMDSLMQPSRIFHVDSVPVLGTGKMDFAGAKALAKEKLSA
ncbi:acyl-[ACP]--phospholipid O-acyltransferase [Vibrio palustris]|uniref:Bifunctional protein Aas n=1 Tax=Vibrio palustris TaxID=1918946 RepID=A0A1R4B5K1_9VIBR|nr:acyl-[ACP]--phospholipid O-acyltransferase [Vibrio palustris]SJL84183.1 Bifunctional protein Aas [Vibrio palustris]